jgi:hypothetical protein
MDDKKRRRLGMYKGELNASEASIDDGIKYDKGNAEIQWDLLEFFRFIYYGHTCVHSLHTQYLIIALLVIEH